MQDIYPDQQTNNADINVHKDLALFRRAQFYNKQENNGQNNTITFPQDNSPLILLS